MRIVLDTVILVRGLIGPHSQWGRLLFERNREYRWVVSPEIVNEYLEVLNRPELVRKYRAAGTRNMHVVLDLIAAAALVEPKNVPRICRDPADDKFLAAAESSQARFIVTEDADLLTLQSFKEITICNTEAFLYHLDQGTPTEQ